MQNTLWDTVRGDTKTIDGMPIGQTTPAPAAFAGIVAAQTFATNAAVAGTTLTPANVFSGGSVENVLEMTGTLTGAANAQLPTVAALVAAMPNPVVGQTFRLRIINASAGAYVWTVTTNTGWTLAGSMAVADNSWRDFIVTLTSLTTATLQSIGSGGGL